MGSQTALHNKSVWRTSVKYSNTKPFLMDELQKISEELDRSKNLKVSVEEVRYRSALSTAMNLLKEVSATETELSQDDRNAATFGTSGEAVKLEQENECTPSTTKLLQKHSSGSTIGTTLKRRKSLRTHKQSMCVKTSDEPKAEKRALTKDVGHRKKRKRAEDTSTEQGSFPGENSGNTGEQKSVKGRIRRGRSKSPLSSPKEIQNVISPSTDEDNTRNGYRHPKRLMQQSTKKNKVQVATTVQKVIADAEEKDSHRKGKYNQLPLPDFTFTETATVGTAVNGYLHSSHLDDGDTPAGDALSSDLSMEFSSPESSTVREAWPNDDTEEDIQLPVIELTKEPVSFERGAFVWCKFKRYPYWPSLVKFVRNKEKQATIIFVEECLSDPNSQIKSYKVSLRTLKHYDCPEKQELLDIARKDYGTSVNWCDAVICDYRIRLGCSFSGSFFEYCTSAISYPVRKEYCKTKLNFPSICPEIRDSVPDITHSDCPVEKKILPDRARAARDKANEKLVECIVRNKQAERHLMSIVTGKKKSHWLERFQSLNQEMECLETYIEDETQAEQVTGYLQTLCQSMSRRSKKLMNGDQTKFILEVMFPEAVIFAISATENLSYEKAEKKYLKGPLLTKRERKLFEQQILDQKRIKPEENL
ncbi:PREDICTED: PWWP domain-containing protein MUM1 [Nanorana parkeri]|uniref:PWWP domain-containing protein MUM1 n=1 Tax=Nanorana parkeri TaxID=125878 RepID=UPI000854D636|nr:PREDICTED: PWWP domain-containing protein MUM1 [Nanorana parkeri]